MDAALTPSPEPAGSSATWSIAEVERDTGLGKDTLRVWERRYGFPAPMRDANGERAYPQAQVQRLRVVKRLLDAGHRPGQVVPLLEDQLEALARQPGKARSAPAPVARSAGERPPAGSHAAPGGETSQWLAWLAANQTLEIRAALHRHIDRDGLGPTVESVIAPLCEQVGQAWLSGQISIYQEHLFTEMLQATLREAMAALDAKAPLSVHRPHVLLTTTPTERHGLGLLMAECFFALDACKRLALGVSTPVADIVQAARQLSVDVVALSFSVHASRRDVLDALAQLVAQVPEGVEVWAGGAGVARLRRGVPEGVSVLRRASDVTARIAQWRQRNRPA